MVSSSRLPAPTRAGFPPTREQASRPRRRTTTGRTWESVYQHGMETTASATITPLSALTISEHLKSIIETI